MDANEAIERAYSLPLESIDVSDSSIFRDDTLWPYFERLRKEAPVHYLAESEYGPFWSITRFGDIKNVDQNHEVFSSEGGITIRDPEEDFNLPMFIAMDPPKHGDQRKVVSPVVAPMNLKAVSYTHLTLPTKA